RREPVRTRLPPHGQADDHEDERRPERLGDARNATHEREKEPRSESVHRGHRHAGRQEGGTRQREYAGEEVKGSGGDELEEVAIEHLSLEQALRAVEVDGLVGLGRLQWERQEAGEGDDAYRIRGRALWM